MIKIPCLFKRDFTDRKNPILLREVTPGCEWVLAGEGVATRKWDGTACLVKNNKLYARLDCKHGKPVPAGAIPCTPAPDPVTGHWPHWILVEDQPDLKWHREAWVRMGPGQPAPDGTEWIAPDGTYELCGPKVQSNPEGFKAHVLIPHGKDVFPCPRDFDAIREWLRPLDIEGVVFHRDNGDMCKIRKDDYGMPRRGA